MIGLAGWTCRELISSVTSAQRSAQRPSHYHILKIAPCPHWRRHPFPSPSGLAFPCSPYALSFFPPPPLLTFQPLLARLSPSIPVFAVHDISSYVTKESSLYSMQIAHQQTALSINGTGPIRKTTITDFFWKMVYDIMQMIQPCPACCSLSTRKNSQECHQNQWCPSVISEKSCTWMLKKEFHRWCVVKYLLCMGGIPWIWSESHRKKCTDPNDHKRGFNLTQSTGRAAAFVLLWQPHQSCSRDPVAL